MRALTDKQEQVYRIIRDHIEDKGYPPSVREICRQSGLRSTSTVHAHLESLEKLGYIRRAGGKTRAISLTDRGTGIPLLGTVAAGSPILAVEDAVDRIPYDAGEDGEYFGLKIRGESMIKAGILDGDTVIVRRDVSAKDGDIVIALLGDEATCKRLSLRAGDVWLLPENDEYEPIFGGNAVILGKVTAVIRTY